MTIFEPLSIKKYKTINRLMRSATCEYMADEDGRPKESLIELYRNLVDGKTGIIMTGYCYVLPNGKSNPGQSGIYSDDLIPVWRNIIKEVENSPTLILMQVVHGGRQVRKKNHPGPIWAPSAVPDTVFKTEPLEMTPAEIEEVIAAFVNAAVRAEKIGCRGVQFHVAHGYLLSQFLSPYTNRRSDAYGGDQEKRTRIVIEIIERTKEKVAKDFIISAKVNGEDFVPGGLTLQQAVISAKLMKQAGLDFIEVSGGMVESKAGAVRKNIETTADEGYFNTHARAIRSETGLLTAAVGGFRSLSVMEDTLTSGTADLISLCRPLIREPDLSVKFENKVTLRAACISCNRCFNPKGIRCRQI